MTVGIVGSRDYSRLDLVRWLVAQLPSDATVVSGGARGVDAVAADRARARGLTVIEYIPDWSKGGRRAGFVRNHLIVERADRMVAFWDGSSSGTAHTIQVTRLAKKPLKIYGPDGTRMLRLEMPA